MISISIMLVLASGLAHAVWNLFTKKSENKMAFLWLITLPTTLILFPFFIFDLMRVDVTWTLLSLLVLSFLFQCCYTFLLSNAYTYGDISLVYPIMRGTGTLFIPFFSAGCFRSIYRYQDGSVFLGSSAACLR